MNREITLANETEVQQIHEQALYVLQDTNNLINKGYLSELYNCEIATQSDNAINLNADVRIFQVERVVLENKQSVLESMTAAYNALGAAGFSVFILLDCDGIETNLYLGTRGKIGRIQGKTAGQLLQDTFKGHFSGSQLTQLDGRETNNLINELYQEKSDGTSSVQSVTAVTGVPALSTEEQENFMQGLERFIDAAEGRAYSAMILAEPVMPNQLAQIKAGYEQTATQLSPLLKQQVSFGENDSEAIGLTLSQGISESLGESLSLTETEGTNQSTNQSSTLGTNESSSSPTAKSKYATVGAGIFTGVSTFIGGMAGPLGAMSGAAIGGAVSNMVTTAFQENQTTGTNESSTTGSNQGSSHSVASGRTSSNTNTTSETTTNSDTKTTGTSRQITLEMTDKGIEQILKKIEKQLERADEASRYGGWQTAAYFIGDSTTSSEALASIFLGLMRGNNSDTEDFTLTTWNKSDNHKMKSVLDWLQNISHPRLKPNFFGTLSLPYLTPATLVSGKEMAIQLSLPRRSTSGTAVLETQAFGRQVNSLDETQNNTDTTRQKFVELGVIRHLWSDLPQKVKLNVDNLTSHLFVSGSTGSGKSNTVYEILSQLQQEQIPFLVIEPTKGEYKHVFGNRDDVQVYSTNPSQADLLKINPFKFPKEIHVLEHIDRLVEIFNVCWAMYAAMPAVLKEAILQAYEASGWDIDNSVNDYSDELFPNFNDLLEAINNVINTSAYSEEVKSNYIGSLATRVKSLTNGLNGQIFASDEIDNEVLFDSNIIVDLSRVGSQETKSLIMGILIMRLNEHRMAYSGMNQPLKHVTVLEEAHNILKRTSTEQSTEGTNVTGKAVEMLSNSIAEMRTYGEGFIIADQSPSAVDQSAIRNTNTKIIMRLPDEQDRRMLGKSAGVTDEQLEEIAKLPKGVAVVYQNNWLEPVLCKINKFSGDEERFSYEQSKPLSLNKRDFNVQLARLLLNHRLQTEESVDISEIKKGLQRFAISTTAKVELIQFIQSVEKNKSSKLMDNNQFGKLSKLIVSSLNLRSEYHKLVHSMTNFESLSQDTETMLTKNMGEISDDLTLVLEQSLLKDFSLYSDNSDYYVAWMNHKKEKLI